MEPSLVLVFHADELPRSHLSISHQVSSSLRVSVRREAVLEELKRA